MFAPSPAQGIFLKLKILYVPRYRRREVPPQDQPDMLSTRRSARHRSKPVSWADLTTIAPERCLGVPLSSPKTNSFPFTRLLAGLTLPTGKLLAVALAGMCDFPSVESWLGLPALS